MNIATIWWEYRTRLAYLAWCTSFARQIGDVMAVYAADCARGKR